MVVGVAGRASAASVLVCLFPTSSYQSYPMKPSRIPKTSKAEHSKYNNMRKRPQLKVRADMGDEMGVLHDTDVPEDQPIPPEASIRQEDLAGDEEEENIHADEDDDQGRRVVVQRKNQSHLFNRSSPMKLVRVCKGMTPDQHRLITTADFAGIVQMKCSKLIPELCRFLMSFFDPVKCVLDFGDRG